MSCLVKKQPNRGEGLRCITISQPPLVAIPNWCGEKCVTKASRNWRHKARLVSRYNDSPTTMGWTPLEGFVMAKRQVAPRTCVIWGDYGTVQYEKKVGTIEGIHSLNL